MKHGRPVADRDTQCSKKKSGFELMEAVSGQRIASGSYKRNIHGNIA